jgi:hypothetical protein
VSGIWRVGVELDAAEFVFLEDGDATPTEILPGPPNV